VVPGAPWSASGPSAAAPVRPRYISNLAASASTCGDAARSGMATICALSRPTEREAEGRGERKKEIRWDATWHLAHDDLFSCSCSCPHYTGADVTRTRSKMPFRLEVPRFARGNALTVQPLAHLLSALPAITMQIVWPPASIFVLGVANLQRWVMAQQRTLAFSGEVTAVELSNVTVGLAIHQPPQVVLVVVVDGK